MEKINNDRCTVPVSKTISLFLHNYLKSMHIPDKEGLLRRCQKKADQFARRPQQSDGV